MRTLWIFGLTGVGHGTDFAVLMGLEGESPEHIDPSIIPKRIKTIQKSQKLNLRKQHAVPFVPLNIYYGTQNKHCLIIPMDFDILHIVHKMMYCRNEDYYSVGGGFVINGDPATHNAYRYIQQESPELDSYDISPPLTFDSAEELLRVARAHECNISDIIRRNELHWRSEQDVNDQLQAIWDVMNQSIETGYYKGFITNKSKTKSSYMYEKLMEHDTEDEDDPLNSIGGTHYDDWLACWAMWVNEENALGGKVVTAPTNGAAGVIPAVIKYYLHFIVTQHKRSS